jgi:hypothetical protein
VDLSSGRTGATSLACRRLVATVAEERLNVYGALARSLRLLCLFRANNNRERSAPKSLAYHRTCIDIIAALSAETSTQNKMCHFPP